MNQFIKYTSIIAIAAISLGCADESQITEPFSTPKIFSVTPSFAEVGTLVTATGTNLEKLDSVNLGKLRLSLLSTSATKFTFIVPSNAESGKLYVYKANAVDSSETLSIRPPKSLRIDPAAANIEDTVTVFGLFLGNIDSIKIGTIKTRIFNNVEDRFSFKVESSTFSGKVYIYKGAYLDSSLSLSVIEPTGIVKENKMSWIINGYTFTSKPFFERRTGTIVETLKLFSHILDLELPLYLSNNQIINASLFHSYNYYFNINQSFTANGQDGTSGTFKVTEIGPNSTYLRGIFSFTAKDPNGRSLRVTNGRLAIRFQ